MRFHEVQIDGFGVLHQWMLSDIPPGVSVYYGNNGSGKTTLLRFLRGLVCGFEEGRSIGLLPPSSGGKGGGSIQIRRSGHGFHLIRKSTAGEPDRLQIAISSDDSSSDCTDLPRTDLFRRLHTAGAEDALAIESLVNQAVRDGLQLVGEVNGPDLWENADQSVRYERSTLLNHDESGRLADLLEARQRLRAELQHLNDELQHSIKNAELHPSRSRRLDERQCQRDVTWLRNELAAAETDLQEAQNRAWRPLQPSRPDRTDRSPFTISLAHLKPQTGRPSAAGPLAHLRQLERRLDHARTLLAEIARARLDVSVQAARIAGCEETSPEQFLAALRDSLSSLEAGLLDLRDDASQNALQHAQNLCACRNWQQSCDSAVHELSRQLYRLCERVSRQEIALKQTGLTAALATISECESELHKHIANLSSERQAVRRKSAIGDHSRVVTQASIEHEYCQCLEHEYRGDLRWSARRQTKPDNEKPSRRPVDHPNGKQPQPAELTRRTQRVFRLQQELDIAVLAWREARRRRSKRIVPQTLFELEGRRNTKSQELSNVESQLASCQQRWRVLSVISEVIHRCKENAKRDRLPTLVQWASAYLDQLTGGRHIEISIHAADHAIEVIAADGTRRQPAGLSRGTKALLSLSLRLALVRAYAARGIQFPLVLDDVLTDCDHDRQRTALRLLHDFAHAHDQQIILLTCQTHCAKLSQQLGIPAKPFREPFSNPSDQESTDSASATIFRGWIDRELKPPALKEEATATDQTQTLAFDVRRTEKHASKPSETNVARQSPCRHTRVLKPLHRRQPDGPYWLSMDSAVELVPSIGSQMGRRLSGLGLRSVRDLVGMDPAKCQLRLSSLQIGTVRVRAWQSEATLLCCIPDMTGADAQLLVAAGVYEVADLAASDVDRLLRAIEALPETERRRLGSPSLPGHDVVQRWIHSSRRARSPHNARRISGRRRTTASGLNAGARRRITRRDGSALRRQPRRKSDGNIRTGARRRLHRLQKQNRGHRQAIITSFVPAPEQQATSQWRFYLSLQSPVVDAPSIGPTTASRLSKIGVITVADLINRPAAEIASRLRHRRIEEPTVVLWQRQARLMCRIPQLRGHDAQVLIACGIHEPEQLAAMSPKALLDLVGSFVGTVEGQRLLRSSNTPDLNEIANWIHWARNSRTLRAA